MQADAQLTQVPPRPTCTQIFNTGSCADLWRNYKQALANRQSEELQLYINRQKDLASSAATAPLQQQIADLNKLVADQQAQMKLLQSRIQAQAEAATQGIIVARKDGMQQGTMLGIGGAFLLLCIVLAVRKLASRFRIVTKEHAL